MLLLPPTAKWLPGLFSLLFLLPLSALALPQCEDIFTDKPESGLGDAIVPPAQHWPPESGSFLECIHDRTGFSHACTTDRPEISFRKWRPAIFRAGDYSYEEGIFHRGVRVATPDDTARFYFKKLTVHNAKLNEEILGVEDDDESQLFIYVEDKLTLDSSAEINGIVYVRGNLDLTGAHKDSEVIEGALAVGGSITPSKLPDDVYDFDDEVFEDAQLDGICNSGKPVSKLNVQFGRSVSADGSGSVTFNTAFQGKKPLVFLMPTISASSPEGDAPATLQLTQISHQGFSYRQIWSPDRKGGNTTKVPMTEVHWLAVTPGKHKFPNGMEYEAGKKSMEEAIGMNGDESWKSINTKDQYSVLLTQRQVSSDQCWLTGVGNYTDRWKVGLDMSEVYTSRGGERHCMLGDEDEIDDVPVAYFLTKPGSGSFIYEGKKVDYEFANASTLKNGFWQGGIASLDQQCQSLNLFGMPFKAAPILIAGKTSRQGNNGGWLRRCLLSSDSVSMVNDEDQYRDSERAHVAEAFSYLAFDNFEPIEQPLHHIELEYSGSPLTCAPLSVTVKACNNADCSELYPNPVRVMLSADAAGVEWSPSSLYVTETARVTLSHFAGGLLTMDAEPSGVTAAYETVCDNGFETSVAACKVNFDLAGFIIDDSAAYAGQTTEISIRAVRAGSDSKQCEPTFGGQSKWVNLSRVNIEPELPDSNASLLINGHKVTPEASLHLLQFDASGEAKLSWQYSDAGKLQLKASYTGGDDEQGLAMESVNGSLYSVPYGLCVAPLDSRAIYQPSASAYQTAGSEFVVQVTAHSWREGAANICASPVTPSFAQSQVELRSTFAHELFAPTVPGLDWHDGIVSPASYQHATGKSTKVEVSQSEVGVFYLSAALPDGKTYLDAGLPTKAVSSAPLGRFVPAWYEVSGVSLAAACEPPNGNDAEPFTYMDQAIPLSLTLSAQNESGVPTLNYHGKLARAQAGLVAEVADTGVNLSHRMSLLPALAWLPGQGCPQGATCLESAPVHFSRTQAPNADGPYPFLNIGLSVDDGEGGLGCVKFADMNPDSAGVGGGMTAKRLNILDMRHGRVALGNSYAQNTVTQTMPLRAEQWQTDHWQINTDDVCTRVAQGSGGSINSLLGKQQDDASLGYRFDPDLVTGQNILRHGDGSLERGHFQLIWQASTNSGAAAYRGKVTAPVEVAPWLQWYWNWQGTEANLLANPRASAFFGQYRGHDKVIFHREIR